MRIIAGDYKGRKLNPPNTNDVRPTTDKVKEAMFSILMPYTDGAVFCDLFSGTGSLGLEALSRGADYCYFCDNSRDSIKAIKENISMCRAEEYSRVISGDYMKALRTIASDEKMIDVFILDPPYGSGYYEKAISEIGALDLLRDDGIIIAEHQKNQTLPDRIENFTKIKERSYGTIMISGYVLSDDNYPND